MATANQETKRKYTQKDEEPMHSKDEEKQIGDRREQKKKGVGSMLIQECWEVIQ